MDVAPHEHQASSAGVAGWIELRDCVVGGVVLPRVLLHPHFGIVVLGGPLDAVALLCERLNQAHFATIFPGTLPVVQLVAPMQTLVKAFEGQPRLELPDGGAWVGMVQRALATPPLRGVRQPLRFRVRQRRARWSAAVAGALALIGIAVSLSAMSARSSSTLKTLAVAPAENPTQALLPTRATKSPSPAAISPLPEALPLNFK